MINGWVGWRPFPFRRLLLEPDPEDRLAASSSPFPIDCDRVSRVPLELAFRHRPLKFLCSVAQSSSNRPGLVISQSYRYSGCGNVRHCYASAISLPMIPRNFSDVERDPETV